MGMAIFRKFELKNSKPVPGGPARIRPTLCPICHLPFWFPGAVSGANVCTQHKKEHDEIMRP